MSIENTLERIAVALESLTKTLQQTIHPVVSVSNTPMPQAATVVTQPVAQPVAQPMAQPMAQPASPFSTPQEFVGYVMQAYTKMGPEKGAGIQTLLVNAGFNNINEVTPEHYATLKNAIDGMVGA